MKNITSTKEDNIIINTVVGKVTIDGIFEHIKQNVEAWKEVPEIWDFNQADLSGISTEEWREMLNRLKKLAKIKPGQKTALLSSTDLSFGMMRALDMASELKDFPIKLESFRDKGEAKKWLSEQ